jgi:hypothetical protein
MPKTEQELKERLKKADTELGDAVALVARCAQELSDNAVQVDDTYSVAPEDMVELRNALFNWRTKTEAFLLAVDAAGEHNYRAAVAR